MSEASRSSKSKIEIAGFILVAIVSICYAIQSFLLVNKSNLFQYFGGIGDVSADDIPRECDHWIDRLVASGEMIEAASGIDYALFQFNAVVTVLLFISIIMIYVGSKRRY